MNKKTMLTALIISSMAMSVGAVDNTVGTGSGIAYGAGSHAPKVENIAIGGNASIGYSNGNSNATGDIVVGKGGTKIVDTNAYDMIKRLQEDNEQLRKELEDIKFMLNNK